MQRKCPWHSGWCAVTIQTGPQRFSAASAGRESCSIQTCSNLSINTPSFLCPRPKLTSDLSRLSAKASWLSSSHVLYVIPDTVRLWFQLGGLSQDILLLSRDLRKQSDLSDRKKQGEIFVTYAHAHGLEKTMLLSKSTLLQFLKKTKPIRACRVHEKIHSLTTTRRNWKVMWRLPVCSSQLGCNHCCMIRFTVCLCVGF